MNLETLQREMAAAILLPLTPNEDMRAEGPDGRRMSDVAASFIAPNSRLTAFERLEIYNRQYWFRVLGALADDFPGLRAVIGSKAFEALSVAYLSAHPSKSFSLRNLGSKMPEWLAANPQWAGRRSMLAIDVARIEWAFVEAFDNAERTPLTLDQIATLDAGSRLALQPHLQPIAMEYAADDLVLALHDREKRQTSEAGMKQEDGPEPPAKLPRLRRRPTWVAAWIYRSTIGACIAMSSSRWLRFAEGCPLRRRSKQGLKIRRCRQLAGRAWCRSGLPTGLNWDGSARRILRLSFRHRSLLQKVGVYKTYLSGAKARVKSRTFRHD
jgi:hypothetical protein